MAAPRSARLVVVGAGISGLAAARAAVESARTAGKRLDVVVLEREREVGGKAKTLRRDGYLVETGPTGFIDDAQTGPLMHHLADVAGVDEARGGGRELGGEKTGGGVGRGERGVFLREKKRGDREEGVAGRGVALEQG